MKTLIVISGDRVSNFAKTVYDWLSDNQVETTILSPIRQDREFRLLSITEPIQEILFIIDLSELHKLRPKERTLLINLYDEACSRKESHRMVFFRGHNRTALEDWQSVLQSDNKRGTVLMEHINSAEDILGRLRWLHNLLQIQHVISPPVLVEKNEDELLKETDQIKGDPSAKDNIISVLTQWTLEYLKLDKTWLGHILFRRADVAKLSSYLYTATKIFSWLGLPLGKEEIYEPPESFSDFRILAPHFYTCLPSTDIAITWREMEIASKYQIIFKDEQGKTSLSEVTSERFLHLSTAKTQNTQLKPGRVYTWMVRAIDVKGQIIDESEIQGAFQFLNDEAAEYLRKDIDTLPKDQEPVMQGFLRGICLRCYGCRLHAIQTYQETLAIREDFLPAVNGIIECLEGSYADVSKQGWYTGDRWNEIAEMYKLRRCLLLNKYHIRSQRRCANCQACVDRQ